MTTTRLESAFQPTLLLRGRSLAAALLLATGLAGAWWGGLAGLGGVACLVLGAWLLLPDSARAGVPAHGAAAEANPGTSLEGGGAAVMVGTVVPVWSRQVEVTRDSASEALAALVNDFAEIAGALDVLSRTLDSVTLTAEPGAVDGAVRAQSPALDALRMIGQRAFAERDRIARQLDDVGTGLRELRQLAKQARELGRHTRLVALNASIESHRAGGSAADTARSSTRNGGTQAVAAEIRDLASRVAETAERIEALTERMAQSTAPVLRDAAVGGSTDEELRIELDLRAREALAALLGSLGGALQGSGDARQAAASLRERIDSTFVHFQFGDRISQQLSIVSNDMQNFVAWLAEHPRATRDDAAAWLAALEQSYTMEEQRSNHHGTVHVERSTGVEFF